MAHHVKALLRSARSAVTRAAWTQVEARSNKLAHHLVSLGVALGSAVGLLLEPSADAVIAALAVLKAGAAYLPLDVASNELLKLMLEVGHRLCGTLPCAGRPLS